MLSRKDKLFIQSVLSLKHEYETLTSNTNSHFRRKLSLELAKQMSSYKFKDFIEFMSDAETIQRLEDVRLPNSPR